MRKYIPLVLFIFSWPVLSADIHGRVVRVLDGDTIEVMDSLKAVRIRLVNIDAPEGNDSNLLIVFYVQIMPDDFVMQLHRF
ncbi:periplasmic endochitinase [Shigella dysenteriae]|nr:hypothetical protein C5K22_27245 [Shigella dysenteriae]SPZ80039.1 periplasmic endochitinase [Shigella dysenteriae]